MTGGWLGCRRLGSRDIRATPRESQQDGPHERTRSEPGKSEGWENRSIMEHVLKEGTIDP
jgi:hypothetical protein